MREYTFEYQKEIPQISSEIWQNIIPAKIDCFSFCEDKNYPQTEVRGVYTDYGITLLYQSNEKNALARYKGVNEKPWTDSCVEIFFNPCPERDCRYFNFELSAGGGLLIGFGKNRNEKIRCDFILEPFKIQTEIKEEGWKACFTIPFDFVLSYAKGFDKVFVGNFQKCGDETTLPHFVVWNEIKVQSPDFHRPEFFGKFLLGTKE